MSDTFTKYGFTAGVSTGLGIGLILGIIFRKSLPMLLMKNRKSPGPSESLTLNDSILSECKLVLVVRNDLKMGKGKAAAQCSHAAVKAYQQAAKKEPNILKLWLATGQRKVVVKTEDEDGIFKVKQDASSLGLLTSVIRDAGFTQIASGSVTCIGVGPGMFQIVSHEYQWY